MDDMTHEATELVLYVENTAMVYNLLILPSYKRATALWHGGKFDYARLLRGLEIATGTAALYYMHEFGDRYVTRFTRNDKRQAAKYLAESFIQEMEIGNSYDCGGVK